MKPFKGLTPEEAKELLKVHGPNILPRTKPPALPLIFLRQFLSPLIYILLAAALLSLSVGEAADATFIFIVLLVNAIIGTAQEYSAQKSASALQKIVPHFSNVLRKGRLCRIPSEEIVPGDIVVLESGEAVPADIRLLEAKNLSLDESLLTGESVPVSKDADAPEQEGQPLSERKYMLFAGAMVLRGRAVGKVVATGANTEIGRIAAALSEKSLAKPPLLLRMEKFTLRISIFMGIITLLVFLSAWLRGGDIKEVFLVAVALAVAATPEGLPAAITIALALGMRRMARQNVIVRKLVAVEALGSCTFIASDKTGTLTINELTIRRLILPDNSHFDVTGEGTDTKGKILPAKETFLVENTKDLCMAGILTNEAKRDAGEYSGDTVDIAFLVLGEKAGLDREALLASYPSLSIIPYESENGYSASTHNVEGVPTVYVKGSAEKLLSMCARMRVGNADTLLDAEKIKQQVDKLAAEGYRVLALAKGEVKEEGAIANLTFLGLAGMIDPLRSEAKEAVMLAKSAGIEVAMVTGDHPVTAFAIARDLGICSDEKGVVTGAQIKEALAKSTGALDRLVAGKTVFARIEPAQKKEIVASLMRQGHFVAVTGDGVNDSPALKHSHVGVAMGKRGTDVARESSDLILTDDNFSSIVKGIHEGRVVYSNIRKVIFLLISTGAAEIILFILSLAFGLPLPLTAVQLLWLNLVTNGIQDVALAFEPAEGDELGKPPRPPNEPIFNRLMITRVLATALYMGIAAFGLFYLLIRMGYDESMARNLTLLLMVLFENMQALNSRSETKSIFAIPFFNNPFLLWGTLVAQAVHIAAMHLPVINVLLDISPVTLREWGVLLAIALGLLVVEKIYHLTRKSLWEKP